MAAITDDSIRPFDIHAEEEDLVDLRRAGGHPLTHQGAGHRSITGGPVGDNAGAHALLGH
jgi:hypothetical protein